MICFTVKSSRRISERNNIATSSSLKISAASLVIRSAVKVWWWCQAERVFLSVSQLYEKFCSSNEQLFIMLLLQTKVNVHRAIRNSRSFLEDFFEQHDAGDTERTIGVIFERRNTKEDQLLETWCTSCLCQSKYPAENYFLGVYES